MRSLACVLIREGPSDDWFLPILLRRAVEALALESFPACREVQEIRSLPQAGNQHPASVLDAVAAEHGTFDVLLYHHDGAPPGKSDPVIRRMREAWAASRFAEPLVAVVPMRETEAWLLADRPALLRVLNVRKLAGDFVSGGMVENCSDPKRVVAGLLREAGFDPGRSGVLRNFYTAVAETADIDALRKVPAFRQWWNDMTEALEGLGYQHG